MPKALAASVDATTTWFVIGGQAVRCFAPYRPSRDVDFGVRSAKDLGSLLTRLRGSGEVEIQERAADTVHLLWNGLKVSIFVLAEFARQVEDQHLDAPALLATKLHAILDRGLRRDFFDLYVLLEGQRLGLASALAALHRLYPGPIDDALLLRALAYFDDAEAEAPLPGEGRRDWAQVKRFFQSQAGALIVPPRQPLAIQAQVVDVTPRRRARRPAAKRPAERPRAR